MADKVDIPLEKFQEWMLQQLLDPFQQTDIDPHKLLPNSSNVSSLEDLVNHTDKLPANEHFAIYQRSYIARLRNCMKQQFSTLEYALGEDIFVAFADVYLASRPSYNYNLALLGTHFAEYLEANRPDAEEDEKEDWIDFMIELAKFEFAIGVLFEEKGEEDYQLANDEDEEENLKLLPIFGLFEFDFPVKWFYSEFKNGNEPNLPFVNETYAVVLRYDYKLSIYDLHKEQHEFLSLLKNGMNIPAAKAEFKKNHPENADDFERVWPSWKKRWIEAKLFRV